MENKPIAEVSPDAQDKKKEIISEILGDLAGGGETTVDLPSRGVGYTLVDSSKPITLRPMSFDDERVLANSRADSGDTINMVLQRCVSNIDVNSLYIFDKIFLIMKLRELSYGKDFSAIVTCKSCRADTNVTFDLSILPVNVVPESFGSVVTIALPAIQKEAQVRIPRVADEPYFRGTDLLGNLWRFVLSVDGHDNKEIISAVISKLPVRDIHTIVNYISGEKFGIQSTVKFMCDHCQDVSIMELPIESNFFSVT
tara:strand:+ start:714 stop:1478 length:765 start_codon:yes stop_codon:yes gene_type:complete